MSSEYLTINKNAFHIIPYYFNGFFNSSFTSTKQISGDLFQPDQCVDFGLSLLTMKQFNLLWSHKDLH